MTKLEWIEDMCDTMLSALEQFEEYPDPTTEVRTTICDVIAGLDEIRAECRKES